MTPFTFAAYIISLATAGWAAAAYLNRVSTLSCGGICWGHTHMTTAYDLCAIAHSGIIERTSPCMTFRLMEVHHCFA